MRARSRWCSSPATGCSTKNFRIGSSPMRVTSAMSSSTIPIVETNDEETLVSAANLPIPTDEFQRMARFGKGNLRAAIVVRKGLHPMSWVIVVDNLKDFPNADTPHKVITTSEYIARPKLFETERAKVVNLSRSYAYQSKGYYASLLGEARGHRVLPEVQTMLELREAKLYEHVIPELEDALNRCYAKNRMQKSECRILVCFGLVRESRLRELRQAAVRLVSLPRDRGLGRGRRRAFGRLGLDREDQAAADRQARPRGNAVLPRRAAHPYEARMARSEDAPAGALFARGAARSRGGAAALEHSRRSNISARSAKDYPSMSSRSPRRISPILPSSTRSSSARRPRSTTTPIASPGAPPRRACRSSTTRSR